jgi:MtfA peptidase
MDPVTLITLMALAAIVVSVALWLFVVPVWHRRKLDRRPFPGEWEHLLQAELPVYNRMTPQEQDQLRRLVIRFLDSKRIVGCAGQQITDRIRISIASQACLLLLNRPSSEYASLRSILVYPSSFIVSHDRHDESGLVHTGKDILEGESWSDGRVILGWDNVAESIADFSDGYNVVLHEFAHQLDHESGVTNGAPVLASSAAYQNWARVFSEEFAHLQQAAGQQMHTLIDQYGASDPAEFFAVVTETFYEKPHQLAAQHPALFHELCSYYCVDPRRWQRVTK